MKNKCTISKAPIIWNDTKLKSIFMSVLVDSLDITKITFSVAKMSESITKMAVSEWF